LHHRPLVVPDLFLDFLDTSVGAIVVSSPANVKVRSVVGSSDDTVSARSCRLDVGLPKAGTEYRGDADPPCIVLDPANREKAMLGSASLSHRTRVMRGRLAVPHLILSVGNPVAPSSSGWRYQCRPECHRASMASGFRKLARTKIRTLCTFSEVSRPNAPAATFGNQRRQTQHSLSNGEPIAQGRLATGATTRGSNV